MDAFSVPDALIKRTWISIVAVSERGTTGSVRTGITQRTWVTVVTWCGIENEFASTGAGVTSVIGAHITIITVSDAATDA